MSIIRIERFATPHYKSCIEITPTNINYKQLCKIDIVLKASKLNWDWLLKNSNLSITSWNTYLSGKEHLSLMTVEKIAFALKNYIDNPKIFMDEDNPNLKYGEGFKLNIKEIKKKYYITNNDMYLATSIDKGTLSRILKGKTTQIRADRVIEIFKFFKNRGVPLKSSLDLIYFQEWGEIPLHFIVGADNKVRGNLFKFNSSVMEQPKVENLQNQNTSANRTTLSYLFKKVGAWLV